MSPLVNVLAVMFLAAQAAPATERDLVADHPMIGEPAPEFSLSDLGGNEVTLEGLRGTYLVIHFGTSW